MHYVRLKSEERAQCARILIVAYIPQNREEDLCFFCSGSDGVKRRSRVDGTLSNGIIE